VKENVNFDFYDGEKAVEYASLIAGERFSDEMSTVLLVAFNDKRNLPSLRFVEGNTIILKDYIEKWVHAYLRGYDSRPSTRIGKKSATFPDEIIRLILQSRLEDLSDDLAFEIEGGHSLMMTIENLVGDLLEEYLSINLYECGWYCCWGSTMDAIDFCKADGSLLQVKNSDNSENSSSSRVRSGTTIKKWHRRASTHKNTYDWDKLKEKVGCQDLSEDSFRHFVVKVITENPDCIFLEEDHPLSGYEVIKNI